MEGYPRPLRLAMCDLTPAEKASVAEGSLRMGDSDWHWRNDVARCARNNGIRRGPRLVASVRRQNIK